MGGVVGVRLVLSCTTPAPYPSPQGGGIGQRRRPILRSLLSSRLWVPRRYRMNPERSAQCARELQHQIVGVVVVGVGHHDRRTAGEIVAEMPGPARCPGRRR